MKRGLNGTQISVEPFHLFRYIDEQAYRFNHRKEMNDSDRFDFSVRQIVGPRLTWAGVTGKKPYNSALAKDTVATGPQMLRKTYSINYVIINSSRWLQLEPRFCSVDI